MDFLRFLFSMYPMMSPNGDGEGGGENEGKEESNKEESSKPTTFTQDEVDRIVRSRLAREKDSIRTQVLADLQKQKDQDDAVKKGEFDRVLGEKDREIQKLAGLQAVVEEFESLANARFDDAKKTLPETILALAPDDDATALEKERWWTKKAIPALAKWEKESGTKSTRRGVNDGKEPGPTKTGKEKYLEDIQKQLQSSGQYRF